MTKDKYNLFGRKKRADVPRISYVPSVPFVAAPEPKITYVAPKLKISRIEPPQDPRPEAPQPVRPLLTGSYFAPRPPRIQSEPLQGLIVQRVQEEVLPPPVVRTSFLASSTTEFFSATKPLASKPRLRIPEKIVLKEVVPEPLPGSREAKLRAFIKTHF